MSRELTADERKKITPELLTREMFELIPKIDVSTPEKLAQFKTWQYEDGTIEGLRKLYEAQQANTLRAQDK